MPDATAPDWIAKIRRSWRTRCRRRTPAIAAELDQKPAFAFWLHLRAFVSLVREIFSR
ncbi:hypothetical protein ACXIUS_24785 [Bosea thiooxidans]|nr:hypothetical protein [Bosea sp. (in: a-proteobacteria)]